MKLKPAGRSNQLIYHMNNHANYLPMVVYIEE